jgi:DNA repair exonuclease SbcCD ATPase subunit
MKYRVHVLASCSFSIALLLAVLFSATLQTKAAGSPPEDNREVSKLLEDIKLQAADLQRDSDELESFTHSDVSWESHATELEAIKERINKIGETIQKLQNMRSSASPWQQEAIDRIIPVAQKLASNTSAAIEHLNRSPKRLQDPEYRQYLKQNAEAARQLSSMVRDFVEYGKTRSTLESLEKRLEVPR